MTRTNKLLQIADEFLKRAFYALGANYDDYEDENPYDMIVTAANQMKTRVDMKFDLLRLAAMYNTAMDIKGGYNSLDKAMSLFQNQYIEDYTDEEQAAANEAINAARAKIADLAGGNEKLVTSRDNPADVDALRVAKEAYEKGAEAQKISGTTSSDYEKYVKQFSTQKAINKRRRNLGQEVEGEEPEPIDESSEGVFDPSAPVEVNPLAGFYEGSGEEAAKGGKRGWGVEDKHRYKNYAEAYAKEASRWDTEYARTFEDPNLAKFRDRYEKLVHILHKLSTLAATKSNVLDSLTTTPDDRDLIKKKDEISAEESELLAERSKLVHVAREDYLVEDANKKEQEAASEKDPTTKFVLEQQAALTRHYASRDRNKALETLKRKALLALFPFDKAIGRYNSPGKELREKALKEIEDASKVKYSLKKWHEDEAARVAKTKQKLTEEGEPKKGKTTGRKNTKQNKYNWAEQKLEGYITFISQQTATKRNDIKKELLGAFKQEGLESKFIPFINEIAKLTTKDTPKNRSKLLEMVQFLRQERDNIAKTQPVLVQYLVIHRTSRALYNLRAIVSSLEPIDIDNKTEFSETEKAQIQRVIDACKKMLRSLRQQREKFIFLKKNDATGQMEKVWNLANIAMYEPRALPNTLNFLVNYLERKLGAAETQHEGMES